MVVVRLEIMSESDNQQTTERMVKRLFPIGVLGLINIGLIVVFYILLVQNNVALFPRLIVSICAPPAVISLVVGIYMLIFPGKKSTVN